mgnify:FL=1
MTDYKSMLNQLRTKEIDFLEVNKAEYLQFREQLIMDEKFKNFRGEAKQGGSVVFTYLDQPRT